MSVSQILVILLRRAWIVVLALLTTVIVAGGVLLFVPGRYDAVATASIDPGGVDPISEVGTGLGTIGLMQGNILSLVTSERVAADVVKRLNLTENAAVQANFRKSPSFGRESIEEWMASGLVRNVVPQFYLGTNVLGIKYKSGDPNQAALIANAFLAATIDGSVAMKAAEADQTARWFAPQLDELRKELEEARLALAAFQAKSNMVAPQAFGRRQGNQPVYGDRYGIVGRQSRADRPSESPDQRLHRSVERPVGSRSANSGRFEREALERRIRERSLQGHPRPQQSKDAGPTGESRHASQADWRRDRQNAPASERPHQLDANPDRFA